MPPKKKTNNTSQSSQQAQPSTSSGNNQEHLIKEIINSGLFRNSLADMIVKCVEKLSVKLNELSESIADMEAVIIKNEKAIAGLISTVNELESIPKHRSPSKDITSESNLLRIHGLDEENGNICEQFHLIVTDKLHIPCTIDQFCLVTREESAASSEHELSTRAKPKPISIKISDQDLLNTIYRSRTMLKGTDIYISEELTSSKQFLFYLARKIKKVHKIAATWSYKGLIYIRTLENTIRNIQCPSDLSTF